MAVFGLISDLPQKGQTLFVNNTNIEYNLRRNWKMEEIYNVQEWQCECHGSRF
jgi:hypothetical protein